MKLYKAKEIKKWDQFTIDHDDITSLELMERAANIVTKAILSSYHFKSAIVLCGPGNNGGDGYVIARLLSDRGISSGIYAPVSPKSIDCKTNAEKLPSNVAIISDLDQIGKYELVIDALFGVGFTGDSRAPFDTLISHLNSLDNKVVSIDVPSGLNPDLIRQTNPIILNANQTFTFEQSKKAFYFRENEAYTGKVREISIGLLQEFEGEEWAHLITTDSFELNQKSDFTHKGEKGKLLVIGGHKKMAGASVLATKAAFRTGSGYVLNLCSEFTQNQVIHNCPEAIVLDDFPEVFSAISIGMGLGTEEGAEADLIKALESKKPLIIDADAINIISGNIDLLDKIPSETILTPHRTELKRLLRVSDDINDEDLLEAQINFSIKHQVYVVQKGKYSKATTPEGELFINPTGNKGMAVAGSGDVLSGIIGSLLAQGNSPFNAVLAGVYAHGLAADLYAAKHGVNGMLPSDYLEKIPEALRQIIS